MSIAHSGSRPRWQVPVYGQRWLSGLGTSETSFFGTEVIDGIRLGFDGLGCYSLSQCLVSDRFLVLVVLGICIVYRGLTYRGVLQAFVFGFPLVR